MEASNKLIKSARKQHTCKINREKINEDLVHWMLISSNPVISKEVLTLLKEPDNKNKDIDISIQLFMLQIENFIQST